MREFEPIPFLSEEEKSQSIQTILAIGIPEPQRLSSAIPSLLRTVGVRGLIFGVGDSIFLAILAAALLWVFLFSSLSGNNSLLYILLFITSPFLYAALHLLTTWKEIMSGTYELMMTCRCSLRQLSALRMLVFGGAAVVLSMLAGAGVAFVSSGDVSVLRCVSISFSALFLFAAAQLIVEWKWYAPKSYFAAPVFWLLSGLVLLLMGEKAESFLVNVPTFVFWIITLASLAIYCVVMKRFYFDSKEGALSHAVS